MGEVREVLAVWSKPRGMPLPRWLWCRRVAILRRGGLGFADIASRLGCPTASQIEGLWKAYRRQARKW